MFPQTQQPAPIQVKAKYKETIRRFKIDRSTSLDQFLSQTLAKAFDMENISINDFYLTYVDDEKDQITLTTDLEWTDAKTHFSTPALIVTLCDKTPIKTGQDVLKEIKKAKQGKTVSQPTAITPEQPIVPQQPTMVPPVQQQQPPVIAQQPLTVQKPPVANQQPQQQLEQSWNFTVLNTSQAPTEYAAKLEKDVTYPDRSVVNADTIITKTWKVRNTGNTQWPENIKLVCKDFEPSFSILSTHIPAAQPNESVDVSVTIKTPSKPFLMRGNFRLSVNGIDVGQLLWFEVDVKVNKPIQQVPVRDLQVADINDVESDSDDEDDGLEEARMNGLLQKYAVEIDRMHQLTGLVGDHSKRINVAKILEENNGDFNKAMDSFIVHSSMYM